MQRIRQGLAAVVPTLRNNGLVFGATLVVGLANYLLHTSAARQFAPGDYSQFGVLLNLFVAVGVISSSFIGVVIRQANVNREAGDPARTDALQRAITRHLTLALLIGLALMVVARDAVAGFLRLTTTTPLPIICVTAYWVVLSGVMEGAMQERGQFGRLSLINLSAGVVRGVVGVAVIYAGWGFSVTLAVYGASVCLAALAMNRPARLWTGARRGGSALRSVYRDVGQLLLANVAAALLTSFDVILCRRYLPPLEADRYTALVALARFFLAVTVSVNAIAYVEAVRAAGRGERGVRPLALALALITVPGVSFVTVCALFGPLMMTFAFGDRFREGGDALWIAAAGAFAMSAINVEMAFFNARKWFWYLPVPLLGSGATVAALPLAGDSLAGYAGVVAGGTASIALVQLVLLFALVVRGGRVAPPVQLVAPPDTAT